MFSYGSGSMASLYRCVCTYSYIVTLKCITLKLKEKYCALHPVRMVMTIKRELEVEVEVEVEVDLDIGGDVVGILGVINKVLTSAILDGSAAVNRSVEMLVESIRILATNFENVDN